MNSATIVESPAHGHYSRARVRASLGHFLLGRGVSALLGFGVAILIVRELRVAEYAGYTGLTGILGLVILVADAGMDRVIPRYFPQLRQRGALWELRAFCWRLVALQGMLLGLAGGVVAVAFPRIAGMLALQSPTGLGTPFLLYVVLFGLSMHLQRSLQALLLQRQVTMGLAIEWSTKLAGLLAWLLVRDALTLAAVFWIHGLTAGLGALYMGGVLARHLPADAPPEPPILTPRQVARFGLFNYLKALTSLHARRPTAKLLGAGLLDPPMVAALGVAYAAQGMVQRYLPAQLLIGLIEPTLMARFSSSGDFQRLAHLVSIVLKVNLFVLAPLAIWTAFSSASLVEFITKGKYGEFAWLIGAFLFMLIMASHNLILQLIINALERSEILVQANLWSLLLVPVILAGAYFFGIAGFVAGLFMLSIFLNSYKMWRLRGMGYDYRPHWPGILRILLIAVASCAMGMALTTSMPDPVAAAALSGAFTMTAFLGIARLWKPFTEQERNTLNRFFGREVFIW